MVVCYDEIENAPSALVRNFSMFLRASPFLSRRPSIKKNSLAIRVSPGNHQGSQQIDRVTKAQGASQGVQLVVGSSLSAFKVISVIITLHGTTGAWTSPVSDSSKPSSLNLHTVSRSPPRCETE
jgi:hypothetical protein